MLANFYIGGTQLKLQPKLSDSGNRVNLGQDMKELDHIVWHDIKKGEEFGQKANQNFVKRG